MTQALEQVKRNLISAVNKQIELTGNPYLGFRAENQIISKNRKEVKNGKVK